MLYFVAAVALVIGVIWALVVSRSFRIVVLILAALGAGAYFMASEKAAQENRQEAAKKEREDAEFALKKKAFCEAEQKRWTTVATSQIEIRGASLKQQQSYRFSNDEYDMTASVKNTSKSKVTTLRVNVAALDCPTQDVRAGSCETIGRGNGEFFTDIPAGEVRQINGKIKMADVAKPRGVFTPRFTVSGVRAAFDSDDSGNDILGRLVYECSK
jgi:hypothetical protein